MSIKAQWRAALLAAIASVASFCILLALAYATCSMTGGDCNTTSFLILPIAAIALGVPLLVLLCVAVLCPLWSSRARMGKGTAVPMIMTGLLPGVALTALALLREGMSEPSHALRIAAYVMLGVGTPCVVAAVVLNRLLQLASRANGT